MNRFTSTLLAFIVGALYGWIGDGGHTLAGVLEYPAKDRLWWPGLSWWVLPQFGAGGILLSLVVREVMKRTLASNPNYKLHASFPSYALGGAAFVASLLTYLLSSLLTVLQWSPMEISMALFVCVLPIGLILAFSQQNPLPTFLTLGALAIPIGLGGVAWESSLCALGVFRYTNPHPSSLWVSHWIFQLWIGAVWSAIVPMWRFEYEQQTKKRTITNKQGNKKE